MSKLAPLAAALTAGLALSACGGSSSSSSAAAGTTSKSAAAPSSSSTSAAAPSNTGAGGSAGAVSIAADPSGQLAFTKKSLSAKAGTVKIAFTDNSSTAHNLTLQEGTSGAQLGATPTFSGGTKTLSVKLAPGTYTFFCSVPGHRMAGMQGTLTVQ
ncbi:MAG: plastocyanin/azurin family copper-binding protein [Solirubrobacteraceae bacterium]